MARPWRSLGDLSLQNATVLKRVGSDLVPSGSMQTQLPPPAAYRRGRCMRGSKNNGPADQVWDIDVSLSKPHRIQSISANLASFLQYTPDQLSGRSISILEGPETNSMALRAAIKSSQHSVFSVLPVMLYSRNGTAVKMEVECRPNAFVDCWCRLRIRPAGAQSRGAMEADRGGGCTLGGVIPHRERGAAALSAPVAIPHGAGDPARATAARCACQHGG